MLVHSLLMKNRKRLVHDLFGTFGTYAGVVRDVTNRLLGTQRQHSRSDFRDFPTSMISTG